MYKSQESCAAQPTFKTKVQINWSAPSNPGCHVWCVSDPVWHAVTNLTVVVVVGESLIVQHGFWFDCFLTFVGSLNICNMVEYDLNQFSLWQSCGG